MVVFSGEEFAIGISGCEVQVACSNDVLKATDAVKKIFELTNTEGFGLVND